MTSKTTTQAEKWREWKMKMRKATDNKHHYNVGVKRAAIDDRDEVLHSNRAGFSQDDNLAIDCSAAKTTDKTIKMIEDFVKQCKKSRAASRPTSPVLDDYLNPQRTATNSGKRNEFDEEAQPFDHRRRLENIIKNKQDAKSCTPKQTEKELMYKSNFKSNSPQNFGFTLNKATCETTDSISSNNSEKSVKKVCDGRDLGREKLERAKQPDSQTNTTKINKFEKCRRTVQLVKDNKKGKNVDKGSASSEEQTSPVDVLRKEGRRLMINYMAEYETSNDSSDDDEVYVSQPTTPTVPDVKFIAHLSSSMKDVKPYRSVIFDVIETNEGKAYSPTTGRFKAPFPGTYVFFLTVTSSLTEQVDVNIMHNFHPIESTKIKTSTFKDGDMHTRTDAMILKLERKDEIWLLNVTRAPHAKLLENCHFLTFSGSLFKV